ncbi:MAG: patatin-like phospholipase family protein [Chloroflexi bacterium]|nr:patatin-like phospholipase family protein [Chloroflexota bacterium]
MTLALVLGGGGVAGIAWETGLLKGLRDAGVDLSTADVFIGTSAGSVVGTQLATGCDLDELYARQSRPFDPQNEKKPDTSLSALILAMALSWRLYGTAQQRRARLGARALRARTPSEQSRLAIISARLPVQTWPERRLLITAVDTGDGAFVVWNKSSGVPLTLAVASSCAVPIISPPVTINGRRYMDGGMHSSTNAQLAGGYDRVVVVAVSPSAAGTHHAEIVGLRAGGSQVALVIPDAAARQVIFPSVMDPLRRQPSARAGLAQAAAEAARLRAAFA